MKSWQTQSSNQSADTLKYFIAQDNLQNSLLISKLKINSV